MPYTREDGSMLSSRSGTSTSGSMHTQQCSSGEFPYCDGNLIGTMFAHNVSTAPLTDTKKFDLWFMVDL